MATKEMASKPTRILGYAPATNESEPTNKTGGFVKQVLYSKWLNWILKTISDWLDYNRYQDVDLYVDKESGSDANNGLSSSLPLLTVDKALTILPKFCNARIHLMAVGIIDNYYQITDRYNICGKIQFLQYEYNAGSNKSYLNCVITAGAGSKRDCGGFNMIGQTSIHVDNLAITGNGTLTGQNFNSKNNCVFYVDGGGQDYSKKTISIVRNYVSVASMMGTTYSFYLVKSGGSPVDFSIEFFDKEDNTKVYALDSLASTTSFKISSSGDANTAYVCETISSIALSGAPLSKIPVGTTNSKYIWEHLP